MIKYTFGAYDWNGQLVELSVVAENWEAACKVARGIFESARTYINTDEGIYLTNKED